MFRLLFGILIFVGGYFWVFSPSEQNRPLVSKVKHLYETCVKAAEKKEVQIHVHSPKCLERHPVKGKKKKDKF